MRPCSVLALIPARSGSKSVPDKNVRELAGRPLLAHSIEHALASRRIERVIVSTDSERYAAIARAWGAETPFLRPAALAGDDSTDLEAFLHALDWLRDHEGHEPEILVHLRPTYPYREPADIDRIVDLLLENPELDSVRTVAPAPATPYKMWTRSADGRLSPVADLGNEAYNQPRQRLPAAWLQNACIDAVRSRVLREQRSMTGRHVHGYVMSEDFDVDTHADLARTGAVLSRDGPTQRRCFCLDMDTVLSQPDASGHAIPREDVVATVNRLFDAGHRIVVQVRAGGSIAGGETGGAERRARTWLEQAGVKHHAVTVADDIADYRVDGRAIGIDDFLAIAGALTPDIQNAVSDPQDHE